MPEIIQHLAHQRQLREIVGEEPARGKDLPEGSAREQDHQQHRKEEAGNGVAHDHHARGPDVKARAVLHRLLNAQRNRDGVGEQRHPQPQRDRHWQLLLDEAQHGGVAEIAAAEVEGGVVLHHQEEAFGGGLVEAELLFQLLDEFRIKPLRAAIARIGGLRLQAGAHVIGARADAPGGALVEPLQLREHALHWPARRKLHDDEGDQQDPQDRGDHQQKTSRDVSSHVSSALHAQTFRFLLIPPPGGGRAGAEFRRLRGTGEDVPIGDARLARIPHRHPVAPRP